jgi:hypothetical protein
MAMRSIQAITAVLVVCGVATLSADRVRLRSGKIVDGIYIGGDSKACRLLLESGQVAEFQLDKVSAVEFDARKPVAAAPASSAAPAASAAPAVSAASTASAAGATRPAPAARPRPILVPAGTALNVRLTQAINVDASQTGMKFKSIVDDPVMVDGVIAIPRGASAVLQAASVQQSGKMKGSDKISLKVNAVGFGGMMYEVSTGYVETKGKGEGKKTARKVGGGAGLGAIAGGLIGGGSGAAIGAAVGAGTGAAISAGGEEHLSLPAETRLQFVLSAGVKVQP